MTAALAQEEGGPRRGPADSRAAGGRREAQRRPVQGMERQPRLQRPARLPGRVVDPRLRPHLPPDH
ncbi:MAG: hypothetical protein WDN45_17730 [Caulobacteraceae bacterium]